ncbi:MAG: 1-deoxy-D-xylulose-5-phosphate reductoisomerase [Fimbriimonadaceae bacterium]
MQKIVVLGATGSIGQQTLDVVRTLPDRLEVVGLAARRQGDELARLANEFGVRNTALLDEDAARHHGVPGGMEAVCDLARMTDAQSVVIAVAGVIGLLPTLSAIESGRHVALASKEVLVSAGEIVMQAVNRHGTRLTPIDSEHSAIYQCLEGRSVSDVADIIITSSGGPFRGKTREELAAATRDAALKHPTWSMGGKITVDSATLMNKGLETIEACWLFDLSLGQVDVVVHPQSIVHSFVRMKDGSMLAQLGWPDMRLPIQFALLAPDRVPNDLQPYDPTLTPSLTFEKPDYETFPAPLLARRSFEAGGTAPCVMNAANEAAAEAFLAGRCGFLDVTNLVEHTLERHSPVAAGLEALLETDAWARETVSAALRS